MEKKHNIIPSVELYRMQTSRFLADSFIEEEVDFPWSGDSEGTAGPDEIDDTSTFDSFVREYDF